MSATLISQSNAFGAPRKLLPRWQSPSLFHVAWFGSKTWLWAKPQFAQFERDTQLKQAKATLLPLYNFGWPKQRVSLNIPVAVSTVRWQRIDL